MPGVGDFNLRSFFRAMGIKNPETSMREFVQPVILVGDMSDITPQYRPPSGVFGGDLAATAGEFSVIQLICRAEGGTLVHVWEGDSNIVMYATGQRVALDTVFEADYPLGCLGSVEPPVSLVETGSIIVNPLVANRLPNASSLQKTPLEGAMNRPFWLPPGGTLTWVTGQVNSSVTDWTLWITDLPASENSIL